MKTDGKLCGGAFYIICSFVPLAQRVSIGYFGYLIERKKRSGEDVEHQRETREEEEERGGTVLFSALFLVFFYPFFPSFLFCLLFHFSFFVFSFSHSLLASPTSLFYPPRLEQPHQKKTAAGKESYCTLRVQLSISLLPYRSKRTLFLSSGDPINPKSYPSLITCLIKKLFCRPPTAIMPASSNSSLSSSPPSTTDTTTSSSSSSPSHHTHSHSHSHAHPHSHSHSHHHHHHKRSTRQRSSSVGSEKSHRRMHRSHRSASASTVGQSVHREPTKSQFAHLHDDSDAGRVIPTNRPATAIDYLGNGWNNEDDIAASWKFMTKQKNDMINGLRLENASWRNWAKQRHNLKTVSPRTLNWLKDSDTTWLYGPLYKANIDAFDISRFGSKTPNAAETAPQLALSSSTSPPGETSQSPTSQSSSTPTSPIYAGGKRLKPVLKHRTASELFKADTLFHVQSDLRLSRRIEPYSKAQETAVFKEHRQPKLRFNDSVEQCISIDTDAASDDELHQEDEDEDAGILMRISSKRPARSIVRIKPTKLKAESLHGMVESDESDDDPIYFGNPYTTRTDQDKPESSGRSNFRQGSRSGAHSSNSKGSSNATSGKYVNDEEEEDKDDQFVVSYTPPTPPNASSSIARGSRHGKQHQHDSQSTDSTSSSLARAPSPGVSASSSTTVGASRRLSQEVTVVDSSKLTPPSASSARGIAGGVGQRAANIVANVKDIVHWASSFVYNSSTF